MQKNEVQYLKALEPLVRLLNKGKKVINIKGLIGPSRAFFLRNLGYVSKKTLLIIANTQKEVEELYNDISFFSGYNDSYKAAHFLDKEREVCVFPSWEILPYETASPHIDIVSERMEVFERLKRNEEMIIVSTIGAVLQKVIPPKTLDEVIIDIRERDSINRDSLISNLIQGGYKRTDLVEEKGEFSIRGGIIDIFPSTDPTPIRIELIGEKVETIREFSIDNQRSIGGLEKARILPVRELIFDRERIIERLKKFKKRNHLNDFIDKIEREGFFPGIEQHSSMFQSLTPLFDYLPGNTILIADQKEELEDRAKYLFENLKEEFKKRSTKDPLLSKPEELFMTPMELKRAIENKTMINIGILPSVNGIDFPENSFRAKTIESYQGRFQSFVNQLRDWIREGMKVIIVFLNKGQAQMLKRLLKDYNIEASLEEERAFEGLYLKRFNRAPSISLSIGKLTSGMLLPNDYFVFVAEKEIFGPRKLKKHIRTTKEEGFISTFKELKEQDYIVHIDYGIGRFRGIAQLETENIRGEFLEIEYAEGERLYVPLDKLDRLQKYIGSGDSEPKLNRLGDNSWLRLKNRVKRSIKEMAKELLELYAYRETVKGFPFSKDGPWHREFDLSFEYEETEDQQKAIEDVKRSMEEDRPMDKLVCGDVGYGKTEVAMRAAFKAVLDGKQVAMLVPTTILAQQHFYTFSYRFSPYPINIEVISRFKTRKEQKSIINKLINGEIDIIIGTHRLLQKDIKFKDLGLVIIDEEQRFGVLDKEKLKNMRRSVDVLTLTATPIPRTLHISLVGIRDLSVIDTPPEERLSIKTYIRRYNRDIIREAIVRELNREGQIFFVNNRVEDIERIRDYIQNIVPEIKIGIAHGQMSERNLEMTMLKFLDREFDLLLCTTIIESGLDIPSVNTIIINRADSFGLAQLYQLRGRVGRDRHQAYAYLLVPPKDVLSYDAKKRLEAIQELSELGSGFRLATRDLEIRGAGDVLGTQQSGHIASVGFDMYCRLLKEVVSELKEGKPEEILVEPEIHLGIKGYIPSFYIPSINQRLEVYRKLSSLKDLKGLKVFREEIRDIYGNIPLEFKKMLLLNELKIMAKKINVNKIERKRNRIQLLFNKEKPYVSEDLLKRLKKKGIDSEVLNKRDIQINLIKTGWKGVFSTAERALQEIDEYGIIKKNG